MKKFLKLFLSLFMSFSLLLSQVKASENEELENQDIYLILGDSIAAGFQNITSSPNCLVKGYDVVENSYGDLISKELGLTAIPCAHLGYRTNEVCRILGLDTTDDYWYENCLMGLYEGKQCPYTPEEMLNYVQNAKLITIQIGSNDIFSEPLTIATYNVLDKKNLQEKYQSQIDSIFSNASGNFEKQLMDVLTFMNDLGYKIVFAQEFVKQIYIGVTSYLTNYPKIMEYLTTNNQNGHVVVIGLYNEFSTSSINLGNDCNIDISQVMSSVINLINSYSQMNAKKYGYTYCDVFNTECPLNMSDHVFDINNIGIDSSFIDDCDVHPTTKGNQYICNQVVSVIPHTYTQQTVQSTCLEDGYCLNTCTKCGFTFKESFIDKIDHDWQKISVVEPTKEEDGYTLYECSVCHEQKKDDFTAYINNDVYIIVDDSKKNCGESDPEFTWHLGEGSCISNINELNVKLVRESGNKAGTYVISAESVVANDESKNYNYIVTSGTLSINHVVRNTYKENIVESTIIKEGSYDMVTYCKGCNEVIESEHFIIPVISSNNLDKTTKEESKIPNTGIYDSKVDLSLVLVTLCITLALYKKKAKELYE